MKLLTQVAIIDWMLLQFSPWSITDSKGMQKGLFISLVSYQHRYVLLQTLDTLKIEKFVRKFYCMTVRKFVLFNSSTKNVFPATILFSTVTHMLLWGAFILNFWYFSVKRLDTSIIVWAFNLLRKKPMLSDWTADNNYFQVYKEVNPVGIQIIKAKTKNMAFIYIYIYNVVLWIAIFIDK